MTKTCIGIFVLVLASACGDDGGGAGAGGAAGAATGGASGSGGSASGGNGSGGSAGMGGGGGSGGSSGSGGSGGGSSVGEGDIDDLIALTCERARTCCGEEGFDIEPLTNCEEESLAQSDLFDAVRRGTVELIEPAYGECIELWRANANLCELDTAPARAGCERIFRGTIAIGGACTDAVECESSGEPVVCLRADDIADDEPGVCRQLMRGAAEDPCLISATEQLYGTTYGTFLPEAELALVYCHEEDGLHCAFPDDVCTPFVVEGAACDDIETCERDLYCDVTCKPKKPAGAACMESQECAQPAMMCKAGVCSVPTYGDTEICEGDFD